LLRTALSTAPAAEAAIPQPRRRDGVWHVRLRRGAYPYALLLPCAGVMTAVLAYPLYLLVKLSFQKYGLFELIRHQGVWIGIDNYTRVLHDGEFWHVVARTVVFTGVNVGLTMVLGTLTALLLVQLGSFMRLLLTTGLVLVWAMPVIVAVDIWRWMVDFEFGVLNWTLTELHLGNFLHHDWFDNPWTGLGVITALIVWGAIPFVAITLYAGLAQVPHELVEAASIDGANAWQVFRRITFPLMRPLFIILTSLSIIWDFQAFIQIWVMLDGRPSPDYFLMSIYAFVESFRLSEYGYASAIALVMVVLMFSVTFVYIRQMVRIGEIE
jgi:N,N'-diacetylchitobiose transport system permease protein